MSGVNTAPATNAEVFEQYYTHIKYLIRKYGFHDDLVEDMASLMMLKFVEKGVLEDYSAESTWGEEQRTASFKTFLSGFVVSYLYHYMSRERRKRDFEAYSLDYSIELSDGAMDLWIDSQEEAQFEDIDSIETLDFIIDLRRYLHENPKSIGKKASPYKLEDFFVAVMRQIETTGLVQTSLLAEEFGVSSPTIHNWLKLLRAHVHLARGV